MTCRVLKLEIAKKNGPTCAVGPFIETAQETRNEAARRLFGGAYFGPPLIKASLYSG
jgi:hypothetical protein